MRLAVRDEYATMLYTFAAFTGLIFFNEDYAGAAVRLPAAVP